MNPASRSPIAPAGSLHGAALPLEFELFCTIAFSFLRHYGKHDPVRTLPEAQSPVFVPLRRLRSLSGCRKYILNSGIRKAGVYDLFSSQNREPDSWRWGMKAVVVAQAARGPIARI
jgi:hypothetical protein